MHDANDAARVPRAERYTYAYDQHAQEIDHVFVSGAVAARGGTAAGGVSATNPLVDVVGFFSQHVFSDLQGGAGAVHAVLQVDAVRFVHTFRNQLSKEQLLAVLPLLAAHLGSENVAVCTYAAVTIERILFIKQNGQLMWVSRL